MSQIPKIVHRLLLYDDDFPEAIKPVVTHFDQLSADFEKKLWREPDVVNIMSEKEKNTYFSYKRKIQRADFARYILVNKVGGYYSDYDILLKQPFHELIKQGSGDFFAVTETNVKLHQRWRPIQRIRKEANLKKEYHHRIANYLFGSIPNSPILDAVIELCHERARFEVRNDYDIIFTTGPDVISTIINELPARNFTIITKKARSTYYKHLCDSHWRQKNS